MDGGVRHGEDYYLEVCAAPQPKAKYFYLASGGETLAFHFPAAFDAPRGLSFSVTAECVRDEIPNATTSLSESAWKMRENKTPTRHPAAKPKSRVMAPTWEE